MKLRPGLPRLPRNPRTIEALAREREFYRLLIRRGLGGTEAFQAETVWDIGCRNWSYARALGTSFPNARDFIGIEVDGFRRYWNLHRRMDYALSSAGNLYSFTVRPPLTSHPHGATDPYSFSSL